ncbi:MAG TPA: hypothetical protein VL625_11520 [Patescibacteria group bacterium]|nr:hypothetical protein [Patescibacteria group bacterium]
MRNIAALKNYETPVFSTAASPLRLVHSDESESASVTRLKDLLFKEEICCDRATD